MLASPRPPAVLLPLAAQVQPAPVRGLLAGRGQELGHSGGHTPHQGRAGQGKSSLDTACCLLGIFRVFMFHLKYDEALSTS